MTKLPLQKKAFSLIKKFDLFIADRYPISHSLAHSSPVQFIASLLTGVLFCFFLCRNNGALITGYCLTLTILTIFFIFRLKKTGRLLSTQQCLTQQAQHTAECVAQACSCALIVIENDCIIYRSRAFLEQFACHANSIDALEAISEDLPTLLSQARHSKTSLDRELQLKTRSRHHLYYRVCVTVTQNSETHTGLIVSFTDQTVQHRLDQARKEIESASQIQAEKAKHLSSLLTLGYMAQALAHELKQPALAISNYACALVDLNQSDKLDSSCAHQLGIRIQSQAERLGRIISRIREFSQTHAAKKEDCLLSELLTPIEELSNIYARERNGTFTLSNRTDNEYLFCDVTLIEQTLLNLIRNGFESHSESSGSQPRVELTVEIHPLNCNQILFSVADNGSGVAEISSSSPRKTLNPAKPDSMGIGLKLSESILASHGSHIQLIKTSSSGSIFAFTLPRQSKK